MKPIIERFLRYIAIDTTSDDAHGDVTPSTKSQFQLARVLRDDLKEIGVPEVYLDEEHAYVYAKIPARGKKGEKAPKIGFLAHMDTSPDLPGPCKNPQFIDYEGGSIQLNEEVSMSPEEFPHLKNYVGQRLIVTDGHSLLGADDKAGLAACVEILRHYLESGEEHGQISFCACPDEEIGHGAALLDLERFDADFAYTIDGGAVGSMEYETFNAASAVVKFQGKSVHPGSAKNIMKNAAELAFQFHALLPAAQKPEHTEGYEGFYMLSSVEGGIEHACLKYIVRDHDRQKFEAKKQFLKDTLAYFNKVHGNCADLELKDQYYNMKEKLEPVMEVVELLKAAIENTGLTPLIEPVRGGTDGAQLSWRGLPCPNFFTGGENFHGRYEFIPESAPEKAAQVGIEIIRLAAEKV